MKKSFIILFLGSMACVKVIATGSTVVGKTTRLNREMVQVKADLRLRNQLIKAIDDGKKEFLQDNNLWEFGIYEISIMEGRVLLTGVVRNDSTKNYIIKKIAENIKVRELLDELKVGNTKISRTKDFFIKKNLEAKLLFKYRIRSLNYEVSIMNGNAYLIGIAQDRTELELLANIASITKGVRKVISYVITVDSGKKIKIDFTN
ncbi:MAG: BON domain-containing protein [Rickettsiales bacterium]|nr:BON domain-containing protein [Rickettsiales bacterium]